MNHETVTLITRPYQEVVDDILTAIVGGVVNEPIIFDVKSDLYRLAKPASDIRGVTGVVDRQHYNFRKEADFAFSEGDNALIWQEGGTQPDDETTFHVDYFLQESFSPLTDINVGSVTRTLSEAISREIATLYEQINLAYQSGFIDSAEGKSLDYVVAILGIKRKTKEYAQGLVTFFREPSSEGVINIVEGTVLMANKGEVRFETSEQRTLQRGQARIDVPVRAAEGFKGAAGRVDAGKIDALLSPIEGISRVTNFEATFLGADDESDIQLRARARAALRALSKGTLLALIRVILEGRGNPVEVWDPQSPGVKQSPPGTVTILVEAEPERMTSLIGAVHETRAAGVQATLVARYVFFKPRLVVQINPGLTAAGKNKLAGQVIEAIQAYVDGLSSGQPAEGTEILKAAKSVADVSDVTIADVIAWQSDLGRPGAQDLAEVILQALEGAGEDEQARRTALEALLTQETPALLPTGRRIPNRGLVENPDGGRASDEQIEAGEFRIAAQIDGEQWWVVLDMEASDIVLREGSE